MLHEYIGATRPNSRNPNNFRLPKCRTETFRCSVIPSSAKLWNELPEENRNIDYCIEKLRTSGNALFYEGKRLNNIKHAQLRMNCSKLNAHLFSLHVSDTAECACGHGMEDSEHFMLHCPLYHGHRQTMIRTIENENVNLDDININLLLHGDERYSMEKNKCVFKAVHTFISETGRL